MGRHTVLSIVSIVLLTAHSNEAIYCQNNYPSRIIISTSETFRARTAVKPSLTTIVRDEKVKMKADACCGPRPFNTIVSICCMGRIINRQAKRCCISGASTLRGSSCSCYPRSAWIQEQMKRIPNIQERAILLTEEAITAKEQLLIITGEKESLVRKMDARASALYLAFLAEIGHPDDPEEAHYIYALITLMHSTEEEELRNEEESERDIRLRRSLKEESLSDLRSKTAARDSLLNRLRGLLKRVKSGTYSLSLAVAVMKEAGRRSPLQSALWGLGTKKQEIELVSPPLDEEEEESETLESEQKIEAIVIERNRVLRQIKYENFLIRESKKRLELLDKIYSFGNSQHKLVSQMIEILDETLGKSMEIEDEIMALEIEAEESEGGSFESESINGNRENPEFAVETVKGELDPGCNVIDWTNQRQDFSSQLKEYVSKMGEISNFIASRLETNTRGNDPPPLISSSLTERT